MLVQMIELEEVAVIAVSDEVLEGTGLEVSTTYTGIYYCVSC